MDKRTTLKIIFFALVITFLFLTLFLVFSMTKYRLKFVLEGTSEESLIKNCGSLPFLETSKCLNAYVRTIFKFDTKSHPRILNELINKGGDCEDYSEFYKKYLIKFGYKAKQIHTNYVVGLWEEYNKDNGTIYLGDEYIRIGHYFVVGYGDYSYCILDQKSLRCQSLEVN